MTGKIIKQISNNWTVDVNDKLVDCKSIGKFKYQKIHPLVGDIVDIDENEKVIKKIHKRKNELIRPSICNIDYAVILTSCIEPSFSSNLLDKMITIIEFNNITPIICFTKYDLLNDTSEIDDIISYYKRVGYNVFINNELDSIKEILKNKTSVFTGQTGVGKSTLLNKLNINLNLPTNEISRALGRGKHTTRHVELMNVEGALIADTPGFSSLDFIGMNKNDIKDNFVEFYNNQDKCKYKDCMHIKEEDCYIKLLVNKNKILKSRYDNYVKFIDTIENKRSK